LSYFVRNKANKSTTALYWPTVCSSDILLYRYAIQADCLWQ